MVRVEWRLRYLKLLQLFPFRYRDELTGKWVRARYVAERHVIAERYKEWEITGPPEIRGDPDEGYFRPHPPPAQKPLGNVQRAPGLDRTSATSCSCSCGDT
jgi:hypothetical protein